VHLSSSLRIIGTNYEFINILLGYTYLKKELVMETVADKTANRKSLLSLPIIALVVATIVSGLLFVYYYPKEKST